MKLFTIPVFILSLISLSFSMELEKQPALSPSVSKTGQKVDAFVEALKDMEATDEKALLNFHHKFFTNCARELLAEPEENCSRKLESECRKYLQEKFDMLSSNGEMRFGQLYIYCFFTAVMLSESPKTKGGNVDIKGDDVINRSAGQFIRGKNYLKQQHGSTEIFYDYFFCTLLKPFGENEENNTNTACVIEGAQDKFYPMILINNSVFKMKDYLYALSKRVHLLSLPFQPNNSLHGGLYAEPVEVLGHDIAHLTQFGELRSGWCPFLYSEPLGGSRAYKCDMYQKVGQYFFDLLQREDVDVTSKQKLKEIGFNLTHENWSRLEVKFPPDSRLKSYLNYLIQCMKTNLEKAFLPECLETIDKFKSSFEDSYAFYLKKMYPNKVLRVNKALISTTQDPTSLNFTVTYQKEYPVRINYEFTKRNRVDWVKSAQRAGYTGTVSEDGMKYDPTAARKFHLNLLNWFEKTYLTKIGNKEM